MHKVNTGCQALPYEGFPTSNINSLLGCQAEQGGATGLPIHHRHDSGTKLRVDPKVKKYFFLVSDPQTISNHMKQSK
jgi:hypothetical protein